MCFFMLCWQRLTIQAGVLGNPVFPYECVGRKTLCLRRSNWFLSLISSDDWRPQTVGRSWTKKRVREEGNRRSFSSNFDGARSQGHSFVCTLQPIRWVGATKLNRNSSTTFYPIKGCVNFFIGKISYSRFIPHSGIILEWWNFLSSRIWTRRGEINIFPLRLESKKLLCFYFFEREDNHLENDTDEGS